VWAPAGFARGFCALSEAAEVQYKCTAFYNEDAESGIVWNDSEIGVSWPVTEPILSEKDASARTLADWLASPESSRLRYDS
jgi:dTDP-4-dehydrorhamnose 3,5-epimerase